jgi:hypothetical protein
MEKKEKALLIDRDFILGGLNVRNMSRLDLSREIGCSYTYLCQMINGFSPIKKEYEDKIFEAFRKRNEPGMC